ncbi:MAG: sigma-70 family RNA polymerase sigma factor [Acidimicrobiales bacterium]
MLSASMTAAAGEDDTVDPTSVELSGDLLERCYREQYGALVRLAAYLADREHAEEVVQDAFVHVFGRVRRVRPDRVDAYLRRAVVNSARSHLRRRQVRRRDVATDASAVAPSAETAALANVGHDAVLDRVAHLPQRPREVLLVRFVADCSEQQIADALGISPGSVKTHASRGLAALDDLREEDR